MMRTANHLHCSATLARLCRTSIHSRSFAAVSLVVVMLVPTLHADDDLAAIFSARGFDTRQIVLPDRSSVFPVERLKNARFSTVATFDLFPEGPSYRPSDGSLFYTGNAALTRVDSNGMSHEVLGQPGAGGTHFLPDGSVLVIGHTGFRRIYPDGRIELLVDGKDVGKGNDITIGRYREVYFSVPGKGIYRLTSGKRGRLKLVVKQGTNGLAVDPAGKYLYVVRAAVQRYPIRGTDEQLGGAETVYTFPKGQGGGDGCTFDAWGNFYTMRFKTGVIRVIDPQEKKLIAEMPVGVVPSSNVTFGGSQNTELFVTAGAPKLNNCQIVKASVGITGFCGHVGATVYPVLRVLGQSANAKAFAADHQKED